MRTLPRPVTPASILADRLDDLRERIEAVPGLDPELVARMRDVTALAVGLDPYLDRCTTPESPALAALARRTRERDWDGRADGGEVVACELDADVARFAQGCFAASPASGRITVRVAPARETLTQLAHERARFDLVFVDADKAGYADYLGAILDLDLLSPHGIVAVDNTLMQGPPYLPDEPTANGAAIAAFNEAVAADPRVEQVLLPLRDGLTLIRRV